MVNQGNIEFRIQLLQLLQRTIQAAPPDQQFVVVFVILAEKRAVDTQYAELDSAYLSQLHRPAGRVARPRSDALEVFVMPGQKAAHFLREMRLWEVRSKITVRILARGEGAGQPDAQRAVNIMVTGDNEKLTLLHLGGGQEIVKELCGQLVY